MPKLPDYYEVLGVPRTAKLTDVTRAYNRWVADFRKDTTPPDPRRESLLREAFETLSDDARREAYDAGLAKAQRPAAAGGKPTLALAAVVLVALAAGGAWWAMRPGPAPKPKDRSAEELVQTMSGSISPLVAYDISGKSTPAGLAFVIEDKVMVANCGSLPPGSQLMVQAGTRQVPVRITMADEALGLCKLLTDSYVGEPLKVNTTPPLMGTTVFAAAVGPKGEVSFKEAKVGKVIDEPAGKAIQATGAAQPGGHGSPLLDGQGRVVAAAVLQADGTLVHRALPAKWLEENRPRAPEPRPYQDTGSAATQDSAGGAAAQPAAKASDEAQRKLDAMPPGQRELAGRLQAERDKAVRQQMKIIEEAAK